MAVTLPARLTLPELAAMMHELIRDRSYQRETRLGAAVAEYLAWAKLRLAPRSLVIYEGYLARLCLLLADRDPGPGEVTMDMLLEGFGEHEPPSFSIVRTSYSNFFTWTVKVAKYRPDNPVELLPKMRAKPSKVYEVFTMAEQARILKATDTRPMPRVQRLRALCFLDLGVRSEEARLMQAGHFDTVNKAALVMNGKGGKERPVPMGDELWRAYLQYRNSPIPKVRMRDDRGEYKEARLPDDDDFLFFPYGATKTGLVTWTDPARALSDRAMRWWWDQLLDEAGVKYRSLHMARHSVGTDLATAEVDSLVIRDWLGHADVSTTQVYVHNSRSRLQRSRGKLDEYRQGRG